MVAMDAKCTLVEIWRDVPGYEGRYEVSDQGRVKSATTKSIMRASVRKNGYLQVVLSIGGTSKTHLVHRIVWAAFSGSLAAGIHVDHKDRCKTNNAFANLRAATSSQNNASRPMKHSGGVRSSVFRGVSRSRNLKRFSASIRIDGVKTHVGTYRTEESAALAYDAKAIEVFGEFAVLNFERNQ